MVRVLILYATFSGNTEEVAELVHEDLYERGCEVVRSKIVPEEVGDFDLILLGTFNWGKGRVPDVVKGIVENIGYKPDNIAIFGSGDSQFGEYYGKAIDRLANFYSTKYPTLLIEQSPRDDEVQLRKICEWTQEVMRIAIESKDTSAGESE